MPRPLVPGGCQFVKICFDILNAGNEQKQALNCDYGLTKINGNLMQCRKLGSFIISSASFYVAVTSNSCCQFTIVCFPAEFSKDQNLCVDVFPCEKTGTLWYIYGGNFFGLVSVRPRLLMTCLHKKLLRNVAKHPFFPPILVISVLFYFFFLLPQREITWGKSLWLKSMHKQQQFIVHSLFDVMFCL